MRLPVEVDGSHGVTCRMSPGNLRRNLVVLPGGDYRSRLFQPLLTVRPEHDTRFFADHPYPFVYRIGG